MESFMIDIKTETLIKVSEQRNFTKAAEQLSLTQPAVSHHISQLEKELGAQLFIRNKGALMLTREGEIALKYAKKLKSMYAKMKTEISDCKTNISKIRIGVTHTSESNLVIEALAKCSNEDQSLSMTIITDTIKNLYDMLENFEIDIAIVEGKINNPDFNSLMLDTDYLVCAMSNNNPLSSHSMITIGELKKQRLILRLPSSATRLLFASTLESMNESIDNFDITLEVDNIATIKDLIRKDLGVSILPRSACIDELRKGKITVLPIENLSMIRETNIVYHKSFSHVDVLQNIARLYGETVKLYRT